MILALIVGVVVGFVLSLPPGPIAVGVMRQALAGEFRTGLHIGLGAASMDMLYSMAAIFASTAIVASAVELLRDNAWVLLCLQVAAVAAMIMLGTHYLRPSSTTVAHTAELEAKQQDKARRLGARRPYVVGVFMSVVNLPSPTFLPSLVAVATYLHAEEWVGTNVAESVAYAIGFGVGAAIWFSVLLRVLYVWRTRISPGFIRKIYQITAVSFFVFAAVLLFNVIVSTTWSKL